LQSSFLRTAASKLLPSPSQARGYSPVASKNPIPPPSKIEKKGMVFQKNLTQMFSKSSQEKVSQVCFFTLSVIFLKKNLFLFQSKSQMGISNIFLEKPSDIEKSEMQPSLKEKATESPSSISPKERNSLSLCLIEKETEKPTRKKGMGFSEKGFIVFDSESGLILKRFFHFFHSF